MAKKTKFTCKINLSEAKEALEKANIPMRDFIPGSIAMYPLGYCPDATTTSNSAGNYEDMESTMNIGIENNNVAARRSIHIALANFTDETYSKLEKKYMLIRPDVPATAKEIVEAIKSGNITLPEENDDCDGCHRWDTWRGIIFAKDVKADRKGFEAAWAEFKKEKDALRLDIDVLDPTVTLDSYKSFVKKHTVH